VLLCLYFFLLFMIFVGVPLKTSLQELQFSTLHDPSHYYKQCSEILLFWLWP
jgi:hypothetical protein